MKRYSKAAWWNFGGFVVIVVLVAGMSAILVRGTAGMFSFFTGPPDCGYLILSEERSPDGQWKAVVFNVDCGATTTDKEMDPRVSLLKVDQQISSAYSGNVFGVGRTDKAQRPIVRVSWTGRNELTIQYPARARTFGNATKYKDVTIKYVAEP